MLQKQESSPRLKGYSNEPGFMNTRANISRAETTTDTAHFSRLRRSKWLSCLLRDATSLFQLLFFSFFRNQTIGKKNGRWKHRGSIFWPRVRSRRDKMSTDSTTRRDELYRSTDYYSPLSLARGNSWRRHRSIILPMGKAIDNANGCALGNRLNECLQESRTILTPSWHITVLS